jgi:sugar lactone lactonase YvrE
MLQKRRNPSFARVQALFYFSTLAFLGSVSSVLAQAPPVVIDAQQTIGHGYSSPASAAVAPNGTVYVAELGNNRVVQLITNLPAASTQTRVPTTGFTLQGPTAVAVDAEGDLFIGDELDGTVPRIIECLATNGVLNGTCNLVYRGTKIAGSQLTSVTVDRLNNVFFAVTGDATGIYLVSSATKAKQLDFTDLPSGFSPASLVRDASTGIYFVNTAATGSPASGVYKATYNSTESQTPELITTGSFLTGPPLGLALDSAGDLFVLAQVTINSTSSYQVIEIPGDSSSTPYIIPATDLGTSSAIALDGSGNIDVVEQANGLVTQLDYLNTINLGSATVSHRATAVPFNFEFNDVATLTGFQALTVGDVATKNPDVVVAASGGTCVDQAYDTVNAYEPYICSQPFQADPQYPGTRVSSIQVEGLNDEILSASPVYETGNAGAETIYPLSVTTTATPLLQPQAVAISGFNRTVYVADFDAGTVYAVNGLGGTDLTPVGTGNIVLQAPSALAMDGNGDLYIADFDLHQVIVVPTTTGNAPYVLQTEDLLQHPISLALDYLGNLYIGDAGSDGNSASSASPGYVVKVPHGGTATELTLPSNVSVIFPQALVTNAAGTLYIGDGGASTGDGQVVEVSSNGTASVVTFPGDASPPTNPAGLSVDAANDLYVLDGTVNTITVVPTTGDSYPVGFVNTSLAAASALASSAGGQSFVIANIGNGTSNSLVYLNGNVASIAFGNVPVGTTSPVQTVNLYNIGNADLTLVTSFVNPSSVFTVTSSNCAEDTVLNPGGTCYGNLDFKPAAAKAYTGKISVDTTAYNNGTPVADLSGTGTATDSVAFPRGPESGDARLLTPSLAGGQSGRKSFIHHVQRRPHPQD